MAALHLTLADLILLAALVVVAPLYSCYAGVRIARGRVPSRIAAYARTIVSWWLIAATMLFVWGHFGRPFAMLGLRIPFDARWIAGAVLCVLMLAYINGQARAVKRLSPERIERVRASLGRTAAILPRTVAEYRWFLALAVTAGTCEELLYRGYFIATMSPWITLPGALVAGAVVFGIGHAYQGARGIAKTGLVGLIFGIVYVATGSLLWPILLHVLLDIQGGTLAYRVLASARAG